MHTTHHIYGIDFSGAQDAGKKIWIAEGVVKTGSLLIEDCFRARDLQDSGNELYKCLAALKDFMKENQDAVFGLDFPFGLPKEFVPEQKWVDFINAFPERYRSPETYKEVCRAVGPPERKRETDKRQGTPFSPYNLWIYKQTYYGITEILNPLVSNELVRVLPMQKPENTKPLLLEICPASTLQALNLYHHNYKGPTVEHRQARFNILRELIRVRPLRLRQQRLYSLVIDDSGGDALDSIIAATATFSALQNNVPPPKEWKDFWNIEGYVYV